MAKERFKWKTLWGLSTETEPKVKEIKFGDGYSQRIQDGLNHIVSKATLTVRLNKRDKAAIDELESFYCDTEAISRLSGYSLVKNSDLGCLP